MNKTRIILNIDANKFIWSKLALLFLGSKGALPHMELLGVRSKHTGPIGKFKLRLIRKSSSY